MNKKHVILIISIWLLSFIIGCNSEEVTPKMIADSIFANVKEINFTYEFPKYRSLSIEEIKILKNSIEDGIRLADIESNATISHFQPGYSFFGITKTTKTGVNIAYDKTNNFLIILKIHVHQDKIKEYEQNLNLFRKYLKGAYRLRPSKEFDKLINGTIQ